MRRAGRGNPPGKTLAGRPGPTQPTCASTRRKPPRGTAPASENPSPSRVRTRNKTHLTCSRPRSRQPPSGRGNRRWPSGPGSGTSRLPGAESPRQGHQADHARDRPGQGNRPPFLPRRRRGRAARQGQERPGRRFSTSTSPTCCQRWNEGCHRRHPALRAGAQRPADIAAATALVRDYLLPFRGTPAPPRPPSRGPPKARDGGQLDPDRPGQPRRHRRTAKLAQASLERCPELAAVTTHVRAFAALMTERRGHDLEQWMTTVTASGDPALRSFVTGLRRDQDAVTAGLHPPLELRQCRGPRQPHQNAQAPDVWPRQPRPAPPPRPARRLTIKEHVTDSVRGLRPQVVYDLWGSITGSGLGGRPGWDHR